MVRAKIAAARPAHLRRVSRIGCALAALLLGIGWAGGLQAQDPTQLGLTVLQEQASALVGVGDMAQAVPHLTELERRLAGAPETQRQGLEAVIFFLGVGHMQRYAESGRPALEQALAAFGRYLERYPEGERAHFVRINRADCHRVMGNFRAAADDLIAALSPPLAGRGDAAFRRRALESLTLCLTALSAWEEGLPWFRQFFNESFDPDRKALGASALLQAHLSLKRFSEALGLLPFLVGDSAARHEVGLNLALIRGGDQLQEQGQIAQAALLYYLALTTEEIRDRFTRLRAERQATAAQLRQWRRGLDRAAELDAEIAQLDAQLRVLDEVPSFTADLEWRRARVYSAMERSLEAFWAYQRLVERFPNSPQVEDYAYAMIAEARRAGRLDDALRAAEAYLVRAGWSQYRREVSAQVVELHGERGDADAVFALGAEFVDTYPADPLAFTMVYHLGTAYLREQRFAEMGDRFAGWLRRHRGVPMEEGLVYWSALAQLFLGEFTAAEDGFRRLVREFPESVYHEDARFRIGVCEFGREDFEAAGRTLAGFVADYPDSQLRAEAEVILGDVHATAARVDEALAHYARVEAYTDRMRFIDHAVFQSGRLLEANGRYAEMAELFQRYLNRHRESGDLSAAVFQLGRAKELLGRPEEMLEDYLAAVERFGDDPKAHGVDAILRAYAEKEGEHRARIEANLALRERLLREPALRERLATDRAYRILFFREHPLADQAFRNRINREPEYARRLVEDAGFRAGLLQEYERLAARFPQARPVDTFRQLHLRAAGQGQRTLELRLLPVLEALGLPAAQGRRFAEDDLDVAGADTLVWIGDRVRGSDPGLAGQAYRRVLELHGEREAARAAWVGLGELAAVREAWEEALAHFEQAQERFPTDPATPFARLRQGDMLLRLGRFDEAVARYQEVVRTREWRGPATVEGQFRIGLAYFEQGEWLRAHGYFQRVYVAFPQFEEWASQAYLRSAQALERMGEPDHARRTYQELLDNPLYARTAAATEARRALGTP